MQDFLLSARPGSLILASVNFCHVNVSRLGDPPSRKATVRVSSESIRALTVKARHFPAILLLLLFTCLATIQ